MASTEITAAVISAVAGLFAGGWWTRANDRQRQLREAMIAKSDEIATVASRIVSTLGPWNQDDWPRIDWNTADASEFRRAMDEAEKAAGADGSRLMALTGLFFRSRSTRTAATLIFYTAAAAQAGKEAASGASKPERRLELFRRFKGDAWSAFFRLQGQLQRDLVSFPSPLGRLVRGRWEARKAEQAVQDSERRMGQLAERMRRLTGEVEKDQPELTQFLKESEAEIEELDGESGKPVR